MSIQINNSSFMKKTKEAAKTVFGCFCASILFSCSPNKPDPLPTPQLLAMPLTPSAVAAPILRKTFPASWDENWYSSPAVYDLDGDGALEIIASRHSVVYVWDSSGVVRWRAPVGENASSSNNHGSSRMYCSPVVGDFNADGSGEIAIAYSNYAAVYDRNGNLLPGWPQSFPGSSGEIRSIAAADIDNDGLWEIAVVKTSNGPATHVWSLSGAAYAGWPQVALDDRNEKNDYGGYNQNIGMADLDANGEQDIICTYDICHIGVFYADGSSFRADTQFTGRYASSVPMFHDSTLARQGWGADGNDRDEFTDSPPVFADMDSDALPEIILFSDHEKAGEYVNRGNSLWVINPNMTRVKGFEVPRTTGLPLYTGYENNIVQVAPAPCIAMLSGNGPTIIVPSYDGYMRCYSKNGQEEWKIQFDAAGGAFIGASEATAGDLDNNGVSEIVFTTYSPQQNISNLIILDAVGNLLHRVLLSGRGSMAAPTLADVDKDGIIEIIISLKDVLGNGIGGVQIWNIASAAANRLDWPTGRGGYGRTGLFYQ